MAATTLMSLIIGTVATMLVGNIVCFVIMQIKMMRHRLTGLTTATTILFFCSGIGAVIAFVYGWVHAKEWQITKFMCVWTGFFAPITLFLLGPNLLSIPTDAVDFNDRALMRHAQGEYEKAIRGDERIPGRLRLVHHEDRRLSGPAPSSTGGCSSTKMLVRTAGPVPGIIFLRLLRAFLMVWVSNSPTAATSKS